MKKTVLLFLVLILAGVSAATVNAPAEIPANINWSFSVELDPTNTFTKTEIYFNDLLIVTAFNDKQPVVQEDFVLKAFSFDKVPEDNTGLTVFVSYFGIQEGEHKIKTKTFNKESLIEEKEFELKAIDTIIAINTIPESISEEVELWKKGIIYKINEDREELEKLKESSEQNLEEKTKSLEEEIKQLEASLAELNKIEEPPLEENVEQKNKENNETVLAEETEKGKESNALTGFYVFTVDHAWYGAVFLIVLLVLLALFQMYKIKSNDEPVFEEMLDAAIEKGIPTEEDEEEYKPKRFSLKDLIKK